MSKINILGVEYELLFVDNPSNVDTFKRESLWGQIDYWDRVIRVFDNGKRSDIDLFQTIMHEVLHAITETMHLNAFSDRNMENELDSYATIITDFLFRNNLIKEDAITKLKEDRDERTHSDPWK